MSDLDPIEDDWKVSRPVRRDPEVEPVPQVLASPSYVWVNFSYMGSEIPERLRVEVPTTKLPVLHRGMSIRTPVEVYIVQGEIRNFGEEIRFNQLNLYITENARYPVATASGSHMFTYRGPSPSQVDLAFIIDGPGKLTVLHSPSPFETSTTWSAAPWYQETDQIQQTISPEEASRIMAPMAPSALEQMAADREENLRRFHRMM